MLYSWIVPVHNEAQSLPQLLGEIAAASRGNPFEIIAIDDASSDASFRLLGQLSKKYPHLHAFRSPVHKGKWAALTLGFSKAKGNLIITIDSDLQDDPGEFPKLLSALTPTTALVSGWRIHRQDVWYKRFLSSFGSALVGFHDLNAPMKVYRKEVLRVLPQEGSLLRFSLLFAKKLGFETMEAPIIHRKRLYGRSKFGPLKYIRILYDLVFILIHEK